PMPPAQFWNQTFDMRGMRNGTKPFTLDRTPCTLVNDPNGTEYTCSSTYFCNCAKASWRPSGVGRLFMPCHDLITSGSSFSPFGRNVALGSTKNCMVASAPSAGCVPQPV